MDSPSQPVLVVGGTGFLGRQVVAELVARGKRVRALVRPGSDAAALDGPEVTVVRGDMLDRASLDTAMQGVDAVVTSAAGYTRRRKTDTSDTDLVGNRNLADAAKAAGVRRFVFTSILTCDQAPEVPHFWHKAETERYLAEQRVPYVALRPGAFLDQILLSMPGGGVANGRLMSFWSPDVRLTFVLTADVAAALAAAVDAPGIEGEHIDLGWDQPVSMRRLADLLADQLGRPVKVRSIPGPIMRAGLAVVGRFNRPVADLGAMMRYFQTGRYVADPRRQTEVFGPVPTAAEAVGRLLRDAGLTSEPAG
ncbi:MAG TPA: SDR family oxidoreductase [Propionibacteriaceae bacterium]|nr:SDR family oxidoreductase [Propionibacteriaceae bacterium]